MKKIITLSLFICLSLITSSQTYSIFFGSLNRNYIVHTPTGYSSAVKYPLVFNLHGYTSDASQEQFYTQMSATADLNGFIVVYPNGISNAWNSGFTGTYGTGIDDVGFISAIIDSMNKNFSVDLNRVYSCGMSNGGFQSYRLACELSDRITAIASVTGSMTDSTFRYCNPSRAVPVMEVHGTGDPTVNYNGSFNVKAIDDVVQFWKSRNICTAAVETTAVVNSAALDSSTADFIQIKSCVNGIENWLYKVYNGGHTWPGTPYLIPGSITNQDFNASQRIWDFFNQYTMSGTTYVPAQVTHEVLKIYPNPASNLITIESDLFDNPFQIVMTDLLGKVQSKLSYTNTNSNQLIIDCSNLNSGTYIVNCIDYKGNANLKKAVVIK